MSLKPEDLEWSWCWQCYCATTHCPVCNINDCAAGCPKGNCPNNKWWDTVEEARNMNIIPQQPTISEIQAFLNKLKTLPWQIVNIVDVRSLVKAAELHSLSVFPLWGFPSLIDLKAAHDAANLLFVMDEYPSEERVS